MHSSAGSPGPGSAAKREAEKRLLQERGWCAVYEAGGPLDDAAAEEHRRGIARNFAAVHRAAKALGGVPEMLSAGLWPVWSRVVSARCMLSCLSLVAPPTVGDSTDHGPDEKAVILYCAFLCSRLLECSKEERSAHLIQRAWRERRARAVGELALLCKLCLPQLCEGRARPDARRRGRRCRRSRPCQSATLGGRCARH